MKRLVYLIILIISPIISMQKAPYVYKYQRKQDPISSPKRWESISNLPKIPQKERSYESPQQTWQQSEAARKGIAPEPPFWQRLSNWWNSSNTSEVDRLQNKQQHLWDLLDSRVAQSNKMTVDILKLKNTSNDPNQIQYLREKQDQLTSEIFSDLGDIYETNTQIKELINEDDQRKETSSYNLQERNKKIGTENTPSIMKQIAAPSPEAQSELAKTSGDTGAIQRYRFEYKSPAYRIQQHWNRPLPLETKAEKALTKSIDGGGYLESHKKYEFVPGSFADKARQNWNQGVNTIRQWFNRK